MASPYRPSTLTTLTLAALALSACKGAGGPGQDFISDDPGAGDGFGGDIIAAAGDAGEDGGEQLELSEADIVQIEGDRLYALSSYSGLTVVDIHDPDDLRALGTWETDAEPFEMYVEGAQAFVMFNDYGFWQWDEQTGSWGYDTSSRLIALDASDPADIEVKGEFTLAGRIQDSRRVGDVLYLVTLQDGYCWSCGSEQQTVVTSLDISDEAQPTIVDALEFTAPDSSWDWQRSVESTTERMYVAARSWASEGVSSFIDVVDISAGDGSLVPGAKVEVAGGVFSRWQMNEHEGVLRVVSQFGWVDDPVIETFDIVSAQTITPLGTGTLTLPMPESLRSARFDGERAYAITAERTDPLFTIDLSDPANPTQAGELEIPGWVYHMEPRGERVLALGFDPGHEDGSINVSLFDVSALDQPALLRRVHFGGDWASFAETQNRIHKAFSIIDDEDMLLVPHTGWDYDGGGQCFGTYRSGVQIIDWLGDDLSLRGVVPARGRARRAFTHGDRMFTMSDAELATFDYSDRDAPSPRDELNLAVHADDLVRAGDVFVRVARSWWTGEELLELVDADDPGAPEPLGVIDLGLVEGGDCERGVVDELFAVDDHVLVVQTVFTQPWAGGQDAGQGLSRVISVDINDPSAPEIDDMLELPGERGLGVGQLARVATNSSWAARRGDHLVLLMQPEDAIGTQVHVVDISDPSELTLAVTLDRPSGQTQGLLSVMSDEMVSWHTEPVGGQLGKVRFYLDRLDLDASPPRWAPKVNVPGITVAYDADEGRAFTVDFEIEEVELSGEDCYAHPRFWRFDWKEGTNDETASCQLIEQTLERVKITGAAAFLDASFDILGDGGLQQLRASESRIFAKTGTSTWSTPDTELVIVDIAGEDTQIHALDGEVFGQWWWIATVDGARAVLQAAYGQLVLVDATVPRQPQLKSSALPGWGRCYRPIIDGDAVYCPMGPYGLETIEW